MTGYTITSGEPTPEELLAIEDALRRHERPQTEKDGERTIWGKPQLRTPLPRKV